MIICQVSYLTFFIFNFDADRTYKDQEKLQQIEEEYQVSCNKFWINCFPSQTLVSKYGSASNLLNAVTRSCEETIFYCKLGVGAEIVGSECCEKNFNEAVYTTEGKCFGSSGKMEYRWHWCQMFLLHMTKTEEDSLIWLFNVSRQLLTLPYLPLALPCLTLPSGSLPLPSRTASPLAPP